MAERSEGLALIYLSGGSVAGVRILLKTYIFICIFRSLPVQNSSAAPMQMKSSMTIQIKS